VSVPIAVIGTLVEVCVGQAVQVRSHRTGETYLVYVQEPDRFRGHEGETLVLDIDLGITPVAAM
jgi:hypothetical protein